MRAVRPAVQQPQVHRLRLPPRTRPQPLPIVPEGHRLPQHHRRQGRHLQLEGHLRRRQGDLQVEEQGTQRHLRRNDRIDITLAQVDDPGPGGPDEAHRQ